MSQDAPITTPVIDGRSSVPPPKRYASPLRLLGLIAASVFVVEALVMVLLIILPPMPHTVTAPFDATLVTILMYPILYRFVVRPMTLHIDERKRAEAALGRAYAEMELRVRERTAEFAQANESLQTEIAERRRAGEELQVALGLVQQRQAEMAGLLTGARAVLEYRDFAEVAEVIYMACRNTLGATAGYVALPDNDRSNEKLVFWDLGEPAGSPDVPPSMPILGLSQRAYTTGTTVYSNRPAGDEWDRWLAGERLCLNSVMFAPMTIKGFVVGVIGLANKVSGFSD